MNEFHRQNPPEIPPTVACNDDVVGHNPVEVESMKPRVIDRIDGEVDGSSKAPLLICVGGGAWQ